jgi:NADPH2 dehydrogenase
MKFPLEVAEAVRAAWPKERGLGARINASDWAEGGFTPDDAVAYARELKRIGLDYVCVSSGATVPYAKIPLSPGYQVGFAEKIKQSVPIGVRAVGLIVLPQQAEDIVASGKADMVALARGFLDDPRWVWHAAERFGVPFDCPPQYARTRPEQWPGARLARPVPESMTK